MPSHSSIKRVCVVYKIHTPHTYCYKCGSKFMCWKAGCFQQHHEDLARQRYNIYVLCLFMKFACFYFFIFFILPFYFPPPSLFLPFFIANTNNYMQLTYSHKTYKLTTTCLGTQDSEEMPNPLDSGQAFSTGAKGRGRTERGGFKRVHKGGPKGWPRGAGPKPRPYGCTGKPPSRLNAGEP
jgi:hypothetical protein